MMKNKFIIAIVIAFFLLVLFLSGCFLIPQKLLSPELLSPENETSNVSTNVILQWKDPNPNSNSNTYKIYFGASTPLSYLKNSTKTHFTINNLGYSTTYYWAVSPVNKEGKMATSNTWHFTTKALPKPSTPTLNVTSVSTNSVSLEWTESTNAASAVLYSATSNQFSGVVVLSGATTSYIVTGLDPTTVYRFFVVAFNPSGEATSNTVATTTHALPPLLPSTPTLNVTSISTDTITLQWTESSHASSVTICQATTGIFSPKATLTGVATSYIVNNLVSNTAYRYFVVAFNPSGEATSNTVATTTRALPSLLPSTPTLNVTSISTDTITLQWTESSHASSVTIYQATAGTFSPKATLTGVATSYIVNNLVSNTAYKYFIVASNPFGKATSNKVEATTMKIVVKPIAPELSVNSPDTYSAVLTWSEVSTNVSGFHIWRRTSSNEAYTLVKTADKSAKTYTDTVNPGHNYSYLVSAYNPTGQSFSRSASVFVGQNYFPMKVSNSFAVVNAQPFASSQSVKPSDVHTVSLLNLIENVKSSGLSAELIPTNEMIAYQKVTSNGTTTYTVNIPCAFAGQPNVDLALTFINENGKIYLQSFAPSPILVLDSVYGNKPSAKSHGLFLKSNDLLSSDSYSRTMIYIPQMTFGNHTYKNVFEVTLTSQNMTLVLYFAPNNGLMSFEIFLNGSDAFSYTVTSTSTTMPSVYPQAPVIVNPADNSTAPSTFTLGFSGNASTYSVYLNSQALISTSSTTVGIGPLSDGNYDLAVKARNSYGLETLSNSANFTVQNGWIATPTYIIGDFTNWATNSNYRMKYDPSSKTYSLTVSISSTTSTLTYEINRYVVEQVYKSEVIEYGYQPIPVSSGNVTFYFNQSMVKPFTSLGIGDSSKESMNWYFTGNVNNWNFSQMQASGTTFIATVATTDIFEPGTYEFKITPQATFSTATPYMMPYYFNNSYGAYYLSNGSFSIATPSNTIVIKFNALNSKVDFEATNITSVYLRSSFSSWYVNRSEYKFGYDPLNNVYTLTTNVPVSTGGPQNYKVVYNNCWYGGSNIPVDSGTATFYFDPSIATDPNKAVGIGDTSKASVTWYYRGDMNN